MVPHARRRLLPAARPRRLGRRGAVAPARRRQQPLAAARRRRRVPRGGRSRRLHRGAPLERPVEVEADSVARPAGVLLGEREHEGGAVAPAPHAPRPAPTPHAQTSLRLAEEDDVGREGEVGVVVEGVASQQLRGLDDGVVTTRVTRPHHQDVVDEARAEEARVSVCRHDDRRRRRSGDARGRHGSAETWAGRRTIC